MKPAPIQLTDYFLTELHLSANPKFDSKQEVPIQFKDFQVVFEATSNSDDKRNWQLSLKLQHQPPAEANVPYRFSAEMVGFFIVHPTYPAHLVERLVKTNGASMLFGALREIIREATARGPYAAVVLPSTSFYEPQDKSGPAPKPAAQQPEPAA
jgi:preprotein translocase subunit SecB